MDPNESGGLLFTEVLGAPKVREGAADVVVEFAFAEVFVEPKLNAGVDCDAVFGLGVVIVGFPEVFDESNPNVAVELELPEEFVAPNENTGLGVVSVLFPEVVPELPKVNEGAAVVLPEVSLGV